MARIAHFLLHPRAGRAAHVHALTGDRGLPRWYPRLTRAAPGSATTAKLFLSATYGAGLDFEERRRRSRVPDGARVRGGTKQVRGTSWLRTQKNQIAEQLEHQANLCKYTVRAVLAVMLIMAGLAYYIFLYTPTGYEVAGGINPYEPPIADVEGEGLQPGEPESAEYKTITESLRSLERKSSSAEV